MINEPPETNRKGATDMHKANRPGLTPAPQIIARIVGKFTPRPRYVGTRRAA